MSQSTPKSSPSGESPAERKKQLPAKLKSGHPNMARGGWGGGRGKAELRERLGSGEGSQGPREDLGEGRGGRASARFKSVFICLHRLSLLLLSSVLKERERRGRAGREGGKQTQRRAAPR